jgi:hypothetical protein
MALKSLTVLLQDGKDDPLSIKTKGKNFQSQGAEPLLLTPDTQSAIRGWLDTVHEAIQLVNGLTTTPESLVFINSKVYY